MDAIHHGPLGPRTIGSDRWTDLIDAEGYKAIIFDCDGTLVESSGAHFNAFRDAVRAQGEDLDADWYRQRTGLDRRSLLSEFATSAGPVFDVDRAIKDSISAFRDHVHLVVPIPETARLLDHLSSSLLIAVGTNAEADVATTSLRATGLFDHIKVLVSLSDDVRPKPAPDIFATAARRLGTTPRETVVFEDSEQGVQAAKAAGMDVLCVSH